MSVLNEDQLLGAPTAATQYQISRSLRFNSADSAYLSRTPASAGNRKTWTWSGWVKKCSTTDQALISTGSYEIFGFQANGTLRYETNSGGGVNLVTSAVYRDPSAWMHIVLSVDTTQSTTSSRVSIYVNNTLQSLGTASYPTQNFDTLINGTGTHHIGVYNAAASRYLDGYLADIHFIDGQALTPSSFGETDATTGQWIPKAYSGTYGTNGFKLNFADNSNNTATTLGKDTSGNSNNWTPTNLSVTAGAGNDSLVDTPTSYGTDTGVGGEVRGNYCTLNPLDQFGTNTLSNGNLDVTLGTDGPYNLACGSIAITSGKWYWEVVAPTMTAGTMIGISLSTVAPSSRKYGDGNSRYYQQNGTKWSSASGVAYGATYTANDVIGVALDMDAGGLTFYKNGTSQGVAFTGLTGSWYPTVNNVGSGLSQAFVVNFGQRPFAYTAPSGFKALCDTNLPTPTIVKPSTVMDTVLYTGTGASLTPTSSLGFSPDLVWIKGRSGATDHALYDTVRGATLDLVSNSTAAETTQTQGLTAFNSNGFTVGTLAKLNTSTATYAGWCWDAGSSTGTNTNGTISSQVRANASAGFSIVTYAGTGANATVGHGLGVAPELVIARRRDALASWFVLHVSIGAANSIQLSTTGGATSTPTVWNSTSPTSTVFSVGSDASVNKSGSPHIAYCFAPVAGYSAFGSYTGNGSTDGPFVYTGFRPRWVMIKQTTAASTTNWPILDSSRAGYNVDNDALLANATDAESTTDLLDITSNGFKIRSNVPGVNASNGTYIYAAFAEFPFQYARAR